MVKKSIVIFITALLIVLFVGAITYGLVKKSEKTKVLLEKFLGIQFETDEKKTYYMVKKK